MKEAVASLAPGLYYIEKASWALEATLGLYYFLCEQKNEQLLIEYIDTKAKCLYLKNYTEKGTLWHLFIRVYRLEM